jgi:hypothetical protein
VIVAWLDTGVLVNEPYDDPAETKPQRGVVVRKRPGDTWNFASRSLV